MTGVSIDLHRALAEGLAATDDAILIAADAASLPPA